MESSKSIENKDLSTVVITVNENRVNNRYEKIPAELPYFDFIDALGNIRQYFQPVLRGIIEKNESLAKNMD